MPVISRAIFSIAFYQQKEDGSPYYYTKNVEKGGYVLNWTISKPRDKEQYDFKEELVLPGKKDRETVPIVRNEDSFFPDEIINHVEFKQKMVEQFSSETSRISCVLRHFFPETINFEIDNKYLGFLEMANIHLNGLNIQDMFKLDTRLLNNMNTRKKFWIYVEYSGTIPISIYEYIKNHILRGIEGVDDLLTMDENNLLFEDCIDSDAWKEKLDSLGKEKKELINKKINEDENKMDLS